MCNSLAALLVLFTRLSRLREAYHHDEIVDKRTHAHPRILPWHASQFPHHPLHDPLPGCILDEHSGYLDLPRADIHSLRPPLPRRRKRARAHDAYRRDADPTVVEARLQSGVQGDEGRAQLGRGEVYVRAYICVRMCRRTVSDACGVLCDAWGRTRCACELDQVSHRRRTLAAIEHRRKLADL